MGRSNNEGRGKKKKSEWGWGVLGLYKPKVVRAFGKPIVLMVKIINALTCPFNLACVPK